MLKRMVVFCSTAVLLTSCPEKFINEKVILKNQSEEDIFWLCHMQSFGEWYEINSISSYMGGNLEKKRILKGKIYEDIYPNGVETALRTGWFKYWFFNYDSIKTISWERICAERIVLKEVTFNTWEDFERCNFEITYP